MLTLTPLNDLTAKLGEGNGNIDLPDRRHIVFAAGQDTVLSRIDVTVLDKDRIRQGSVSMVCPNGGAESLLAIIDVTEVDSPDCSHYLNPVTGSVYYGVNGDELSAHYLHRQLASGMKLSLGRPYSADNNKCVAWEVRECK